MRFLACMRGDGEAEELGLDAHEVAVLLLLMPSAEGPKRPPSPRARLSACWCRDSCKYCGQRVDNERAAQVGMCRGSRARSKHLRCAFFRGAVGCKASRSALSARGWLMRRNLWSHTNAGRSVCLPDDRDRVAMGGTHWAGLKYSALGEPKSPIPFSIPSRVLPGFPALECCRSPPFSSVASSAFLSLIVTSHGSLGPVPICMCAPREKAARSFLSGPENYNGPSHWISF